MMLNTKNPEPARMTRTFLFSGALFSALLWALLRGGSHAATPAASAAGSLTPEQQLTDAIEQLQSGRAQEALKNLRALTHSEPEFRLGQLMYGELLAAMSGAGGGTLLAAADNGDPRIKDLAEEARLRLASEKAVPPTGAVPSNILQLSRSHKYVVIVDLPRARLYLMENRDGELRLLRHQYAAMGRNGYGKQASGDLRTPVGVYHVTGWINDNKLPELYGAGAFPVSYPNPWDVFKKRSGNGIWLHGVPRNTYSRPPRSSEGCVTMANADLLALKPYIRLGETPVILSDNVEWLDKNVTSEDREDWLGRIEAWRGRWSAKDTEAYLAYYGEDFTAEGMNRAQFVEHKRRVNAAKKFIEVKLSDVNLFRYPGAGEPLLLAEFTMDYQSDNYSSHAQKQQFWRKEKNGEWKIFREENR